MRIKAMLGVILFSVALIVACKKSNTNPGFTPNCTGAAKSFSRDVFPVFKSVVQVVIPIFQVIRRFMQTGLQSEAGLLMEVCHKTALHQQHN